MVTMASNDYDSIAKMVAEAQSLLISNTKVGGIRQDTSDCIPVTRNGWIEVVVSLQRIHDWAAGLAQSHRFYEKETEMRQVKEREFHANEYS